MDIKSTKDCNTGIGVVVKYPSCIMDNDRVRLYGKRTADVHSIASPTRFEAFLFLIKGKKFPQLTQKFNPI